MKFSDEDYHDLKTSKMLQYDLPHNDINKEYKRRQEIWTLFDNTIMKLEQALSSFNFDLGPSSID